MARKRRRAFRVLLTRNLENVGLLVHTHRTCTLSPSRGAAAYQDRTCFQRRPLWRAEARELRDRWRRRLQRRLRETPEADDDDVTIE